MSERAWCSVLARGVRIAVQIQANAKKTEVVGVLGEVLKLKLAAQPIEGKANEALVRYLAEALGVARSAVVITHGLSNKRKLIEVTAPGLDPSEVERLLKVPATRGG